jgi:hypothetical protein
MDFIEEWFGISPDGGSGATELLYVVLGVLIVFLILARRWIMPRLSRGFSRLSK